MNIVIRADASIHIGSGHIMRCLVLADALKQEGHSILFAMRPQQGDMFDFVENKGFQTQALPKYEPIEPKHSADYEAWLQVSADGDAQDFIRLIDCADVVLIDHYGITDVWEQKVTSHYDCKLVAIDDLMRKHDVNLIVDQTLGRLPTDYLSSQTDKVLAGVDYALLNKRFSKLHRQQHTTSKIIENHKILVTMGGIDKPNATLKTLETLKNILSKGYVSKYSLSNPFFVTVLLSSRAVNYEEVQAYCEKESQWIKHIDFVDDMAAIMQEHSIAIGAAGSTSWERACLGVPSIIIPLADNQKYICQSLVEHGLSLSVALEDIDSLLLPALNQLIATHSEMRKRNLAVCDGQGVERVTKNIMQLIESIR